MSDPKPDVASQVSRRRFLGGAAVGGAALVAVTFAGTPARAANKVPQKSVSYQPTPKGALRCDNCAFWQTPNACKLVDGTIEAAGWCSLYRKK